MTKRIIASVLWFYALWCIGAALQMATGLPEVLGPAAGVVAAYLLLAPAVRARRAQATAKHREGIAATTAVRDTI